MSTWASIHIMPLGANVETVDQALYSFPVISPSIACVTFSGYVIPGPPPMNMNICPGQGRPGMVPPGMGPGPMGMVMTVPVPGQPPPGPRKQPGGMDPLGPPPGQPGLGGSGM